MLSRRPGARTIAAAVLAAAFQAPPQKFVPDPVQPSDVKVRLDLVGAIPTKENPTSPTVAGSSLLLIDQGGAIYLWNGARAETLLSKSTVPAGVKLVGAEPIINVAANKAGTTVYVMFISSTAPKETPKRMSPHDESRAWYLLYAFDFDGTSLAHPRAIAAMQERVDGHSGGGLTVLPDDSVLFAAGDNGDSYEDGGDFSQDPSNHLAKLVRIDPATGQMKIVAVGVRACQRLAVDMFDGDARLSFIDPGGWVSEELDSIRVADLLGASTPVNFGWGRSPRDGRSREGSFYLDKLGNSTAKAPADEPGFISPTAEVGREHSPVFAVSGPVHSATSFSRITFLFADLVGGAAFATTGPPTTFHQPVMAVNLVDAQMQPTTFQAVAGGRPDPRFFNFPDGTAGVLLERTGNFYRLTEIKP